VNQHPGLILADSSEAGHDFAEFYADFIVFEIKSNEFSYFGTFDSYLNYCRSPVP